LAKPNFKKFATPAYLEFRQFLLEIKNLVIARPEKERRLNALKDEIEIVNFNKEP